MMEKIKIAPGVFYIRIPDVSLNILCGSPMDAIKHLMQQGHIREIEKDGVVYETGANALLLSDISMQKGNFWNLAEFPVLHMLYRQGMIIPGHPGNTGIRPLLIGTPEQLEAQSRYLFRGTYGLSSVEELEEAGYAKKEAQSLWRIKRKFHFDIIKDTEEIMDFISIREKPIKLGKGGKVVLERLGLNHYRFVHGSTSVDVNMNLGDHEQYQPSYNLGYHRIEKEYFSVIHSGEGNGWDKDNPCMGSILTYQGKLYLIDAGPNIQTSLTALGICINEVDGIFCTHAHDDHFSGLTSLIQSERKIRFYATAPVRASVMKKMCALLGRDESIFEKIFDSRELTYDTWNDIDGLEVLPRYSPHPVETSILFFRTIWQNGFKTYAHLADIASKRVLKGFITKDKDAPGLTKSFFDKVWKNYYLEADIKKIDAGGGSVHGEAVDFTNDTSTKIILSHTRGGITDKEKEIGSNATFGMQEVMIPSNENYHYVRARDYLYAYFPLATSWSINLLLNGAIKEFHPGTILVRKGDVPESIYLILSGNVEYVRTDKDISNALSAGGIIGEIFGYLDQPVKGTYRTACYCRALVIPVDVYKNFIQKNHLDHSVRRLHELRSFIQNTRLLGSLISYHIQDLICRQIKEEKVAAGTVFRSGERDRLYLLKEGKAEVYAMERKLCDLKTGDPFCIENALILLQDKTSLFDVRFKEKGTVYSLPSALLYEIPIVQIELLEMFENRVNSL